MPTATRTFQVFVGLTFEDLKAERAELSGYGQLLPVSDQVISKWISLGNNSTLANLRLPANKVTELVIAEAADPRILYRKPAEPS